MKTRYPGLSVLVTLAMATWFSGCTDEDCVAPVVAPSAITNLRVASATSESVLLTWSIDPGGPAPAAFEVRMSTELPVDDGWWAAGMEPHTEPVNGPDSLGVCSVRVVDLDSGTYFTVRSVSEAGEVSAPSNVVHGITAPTGVTRIPPFNGMGGIGMPTWSPDGSRLAFKANRLGSPQYSIVVARADGTDLRLYGSPEQSISNPSWSPDGTRIACDLRDDGVVGLIDVDTGALTPLPGTGADGETRCPQWSPDGTKLVFHVLGDNGLNLRIFDLVDGSLQVLTDGDGGVNGFSFRSCPAWSPDGTTIAYSGSDSTLGDIYTIPAAGGIPTRITEDGGMDPCWSPDGSFLMYERVVAADYEQLYVVPAEGGTPEPACDDLGYGADASWGHDPTSELFGASRVAFRHRWHMGPDEIRVFKVCGDELSP